MAEATAEMREILDEVRTLATYLAEVSTDFDKGAFGPWLFEQFAVMLASAKAQA